MVVVRGLELVLDDYRAASSGVAREQVERERAYRSFAGLDFKVQPQHLPEVANMLFEPWSEIRSLVGPRLTCIEFPDAT